MKSDQAVRALIRLVYCETYSYRENQTTQLYLFPYLIVKDTLFRGFILSSVGYHFQYLGESISIQI
jgi:hypothetical protein